MFIIFSLPMWLVRDIFYWITSPPFADWQLVSLTPNWHQYHRRHPHRHHHIHPLHHHHHHHRPSSSHCHHHHRHWLRIIFADLQVVHTAGWHQDRMASAHKQIPTGILYPIYYQYIPVYMAGTRTGWHPHTQAANNWHFICLPVHSSVFQYIPVYSSVFQYILVYSSIYSSIFQYIPVYSSIFQCIQVYFSIYSSIFQYIRMVQGQDGMRTQDKQLPTGILYENIVNWPHLSQLWKWFWKGCSFSDSKWKRRKVFDSLIKFGRFHFCFKCIFKP